MENTQWVKVDNRQLQKIGNDGAFLAGAGTGAGIVGLVALVHNASKDERHKQELQEAYSQGCSDTSKKMAQTILAKDMEIAYLKSLANMKDTEKNAEIDRKDGIIENLAKALKLSELRNTTPMLSSGNTEN